MDDEVFLRLHEERNADELFRLVDENRDHLRPWFAWVDANTSAENTRQFVHTMLLKLADGIAYGFEIMFLRKMVGAIELRLQDAETAEIGYWLVHDAQGQGIASRAVTALLRFSFADLGLTRVRIRCAKDNRKSRAIPERLGFTLEATVPGQEVRGQDQIVYSLGRDEWETRPKARRSPRS